MQLLSGFWYTCLWQRIPLNRAHVKELVSIVAGKVIRVVDLIDQGRLDATLSSGG